MLLNKFIHHFTENSTEVKYSSNNCDSSTSVAGGGFSAPQDSCNSNTFVYTVVNYIKRWYDDALPFNFIYQTWCGNMQCTLSSFTKVKVHFITKPCVAWGEVLRYFIHFILPIELYISRFYFLISCGSACGICQN